MLAILSLDGRVSSEPLCGDGEVVRDSTGRSPVAALLRSAAASPTVLPQAPSAPVEAHVRSTSGDSAGKDDVTHAGCGCRHPLHGAPLRAHEGLCDDHHASTHTEVVIPELV